MKISKANLKTLLLNVSKDPTRGVLNSIYLDNGTAVATDGHTLFTCSVSGGEIGAYFLSAEGAARALKTQSGKVVDVRDHVSTAQTDYPQWDLIIPTRRLILTVTNKVLLSAAAKRDMPHINFTFGKTNKYQHYYGRYGLDCIDEIKCKTGYEGKDVSFKLSTKLLSRSKYINTTEINYNSFCSPIVLISEDGSTFLLMPSDVLGGEKKIMRGAIVPECN